MKSRTSDPYHYLYHDTMKMICWPHDQLIQIKKRTFRKLYTRFLPLLSSILATLGVMVLFLGGAYFFLVQLAKHGW